MIRPIVMLLASSLTAVDDDGPLSLADLAAYRAALQPGAPGLAQPATFRDLWDHPEQLQGRRVAVSGRVGARFRQGARGEFPPLVELWIVSPQGDPTCLVYPEGGPDLGTDRDRVVRFSGVFLRRIRYRGGDSDRLAPLIVGDAAPIAERPTAEMLAWGSSGSRVGLSVAAAVAVAAVLVGRHLAAPRRRRVERGGPEPLWYRPEEMPADGEFPAS